MKCIIPLAGLGSRLRPHTHTKAKPLLHIAGRPVIDYILDQVEKTGIKDVVFIIGYMGDQIKEYIQKNHTLNATFIEQKELAGQAHAILLAEKEITEDVVIWFSDTLSDVDLKETTKGENAGVIYTKEVDDPQRFGVVEHDSTGTVTTFVEKPEHPKSNNVNIGLYYIRDHKGLVKALNKLINMDKKTKGEFYLVDAFNIMIENGAKFKNHTVEMWEDAGKKETLLKSNRYYLDHGSHKVQPVENSTIKEPVFIEKGAIIKNSTIGPYVSVAKDATIEDSTIEDSIIGKGAHVTHSNLSESLIGQHARIRGMRKHVNVGDHSEVDYE